MLRACTCGSMTMLIFAASTLFPGAARASDPAR
jgi:hypothetical protein